MTQERTFLAWLIEDTVFAQRGVIELLQRKDELLYETGQALRSRYMDLIGRREQEVLTAELDLELTERKAQLIRAAINRREPVDLTAIEEQLEEERTERMTRLELEDRTAEPLPVLTDQEREEQHRLYREITGSYHPRINPDRTPLQEQLYEEALDAYRRMNLQELRVIHSILFPQSEEESLSQRFEYLTPETEQLQRATVEARYNRFVVTDYSLAARIYPRFEPKEDEQIHLDTALNARKEIEALQAEIKEIENSFPFTTVDMMNDPLKLKEYEAELLGREARCRQEAAELETRIDSMLKEVRA